MLNLPRWAQGTVLALTLSSLAPTVATNLVAHAQDTRSAPPVPANFVSLAGDGWTMMAPPDWALTTVQEGVQQVKGTLPNGVPGTISVFKFTGAPPTMDPPTLATQFKQTDAMKGVQFGDGNPGQVSGQASIDVPLSTSGGGGYFRAFMTPGTGWVVLVGVETPSSDAMNAGLDAMGPSIGSFALT